ncbi:MULTISPECIES: hypothetical protein [Leptolyngbya]|uniref:hypothetical protein n=1 Tax=Leptolyngbya TaxID=47251 RepID=UPI0003765AEA|nr:MULTISPECIES: hypothetical protein [Leptolyngbya]MBD2372820.1 hypothetical protein [Leptolyngbya sp. FACHB-238]MBD2397428.1 hypothetical protein [Leptolyngbya sp. FACHB-239]MBD2403767.1 hypothetical protein [Leptolyngbya sp. FACHB-402]ULP33423.1 hypothetical protein MCP04_30295 [Leptolyngbya boryana IU 594]
MNKALLLVLSVLGVGAIGVTGYRIVSDQSTSASPAANVRPMTQGEIAELHIAQAVAQQQTTAKLRPINRSTSSSSERPSFLSQVKKAVLHPSLGSLGELLSEFLRSGLLCFWGSDPRNKELHKRQSNSF